MYNERIDVVVLHQKKKTSVKLFCVTCAHSALKEKKATRLIMDGNDGKYF